MKDFEAMTAKARSLDMDIALDLALNASADHPWLTEHPEWFNARPDGTLKYAENPPKKYQDIYNFNWNSEDWRGLWDAFYEIVRGWVDRGVKIFRVDNPHTKPFPFWEWLIEEIRKDDPDVLFLAEAFTRRKVMQQLAKLGFSQSYTYFTWKNSRWELREYLSELAYGEEREYFRPNFFTNTPDILHEYLVEGGVPAFYIRLILAGLLSPTYGIYSGYEHYENVPVTPGSEEYLDSEKYELKKRKLDGDMLPFIERFNAIRREHPALQHFTNLHFLDTENDALLAFAKRHGDDTVIAIVNVDPHHAQEGVTTVPYDLGLPPAFGVTDLLSGERFDWSLGRNYVRLDPAFRVAHIFEVDQVTDVVEPARLTRAARRTTHPAGHWFESDPLWFKKALFYEIHLRGFHDGNADGSGDFRGLTEKLDYLEWLGVDCIWLLPMYASPLRDGGYDIADYEAIHPDYGTMDDVREFLEAAHQRGMRVIADLVMNHTSSDHLWFQESRKGGDDNPYSDWYVWSDTDERYSGRAHHLHGHRGLQLDVGPGARRLLLAPLLRPPARPQLREPGRPRGDAQRAALLARPRPRRLPPRRRPVPLRGGGDDLREPAADARVPQDGPQDGGRGVPRQGPARRGQPVAGGRRRVLRRRRRVPHGVPLPRHAAHVHGHAPRGRHADLRDPRSHAGDPRLLPVGPLPAQPRRADARDGHGRGARLHVLRVRQGPAHEDQRGHPPPARPAARQRPRRHRADARDPLQPARARPSSTTATRSRWATTSSSATATACARRCSGRPTATAASPARTSPSSTRRR